MDNYGQEITESNRGEIEKRDEKGRFGRGNQMRLGKANPIAGKREKFRAALMKAITERDIKEVVHSLLCEAKNGNVFAIKEILDRACGTKAICEINAEVEEIIVILPDSLKDL